MTRPYGTRFELTEAGRKATNGKRTDRAALDAIAHQLDGREWNPDDLDRVADLVRQTGRTIREAE